jgi:hypothetical protein
MSGKVAGKIDIGRVCLAWQYRGQHQADNPWLYQNPGRMWAAA